MTYLDLSGKSMAEEHDASRRKREDAMFAYEEMITRYHGWYYSANAKARTKLPANPAFEMLATMQASLIAGSPQWILQAMRSDDPEMELRAAGLQYSMNRLSRLMGLKKTARKVLVDWFFHGGYTVIQNERMPYADRGPLNGPPMRPSLTRCSPHMVESDARALDREDDAWRSYGAITSIKALLETAKKEPDGGGWYTEIIESLQPDTDEVLKLIGRTGKSLQRDDFIMRSVWVPDEQLDEKKGPAQGFWGTMHFYAQTTSRKRTGQEVAPFVEIRDPQPAYCGRHGPIQYFTQYYVPDRVEPLSVMIAIEEIARSLTIREAVYQRAVEAYKRILVNGTGDKSLAKKVLNSPHLHVLNVDGFDISKMKDFIFGGPDAVMMAMREFDEDRLQQRSGIGAAQMGRTRQGVTATADTLAAGGAASRTDDMRDMFYDGWTEAGETLAEVIDTNDEFYIGVSPEAAYAMSKIGPKNGLVTGIKGGRKDGQTFEDYDISCAPMSMRYKSEMEIRAQSNEDIEFWNLVGPSSVANPHLDWPQIIADRAAATGNPKLPSRFNQQAAEMMAAIALHTAVQGAYQPGQSRPQPVSARATIAKPQLQSVGGKSQGAGQKSLGGGSARTATPGQKAGAKAGGIAKIGATK